MFFYLLLQVGATLIKILLNRYPNLPLNQAQDLEKIFKHPLYLFLIPEDLMLMDYLHTHPN